MKPLVFLCITCLFFSGCTAFGYMIGSTAKQNEELDEIQSGDDVYITLVDGNKTEGQFCIVKDSSLYLIIEKHDWAIPVTDIEQIEVADIKWRFVGAAVGLGLDVLFAGLIMADNPIMGDDFHLGF